MSGNDKIAYFPVAAFTVVMGLAGFAIAVRSAELQQLISLRVSPLLVTLAVVLFVVISLLYLLKLVRFPQAVRAEFEHPIKLQFFPAISISLLLVGSMLFTGVPTLASWLWGIGALLHLLFTLLVLNAWLHRSGIEIVHSNPSWFIPVVGNILVPIGGVSMAPLEISWFFFSIGLLFWLILFSIIFYRLVFHPPMPGKLVPTLAILLAPPSVGFISYVLLNGSVDNFARILYYVALFILLLLLSQAGRFLRLRFALSTWAYSFPLAAMTVASTVMLKHTGMQLFNLLSNAILMLLVVIIALLLMRTVSAIRRDEICVPD
jgi:tellurite resistance protein